MPAACNWPARWNGLSPNSDWMMKPMTDPVAAFEQLCAKGHAPDLAVFVQEFGPLSPSVLAAVVRMDQRRRWKSGPGGDPTAIDPVAPVAVEGYFKQFPELGSDTEIAIDLIFNEYMIRNQAGQKPEMDDYLRRFPDHAATLKDQIDLYRALGT